MRSKIIFFGNIYVDSKENFLRMKDSFDSIYKKKLFDKYVINIRGKFTNQSVNFLKKKNIKSIYNLSSDFGWYHDSYCLLKNLDFDYIFCWLEDFICIDKKNFKKLLDEIYKTKIDIINYTHPYIINKNNKKFKQNNIFKYKIIFKKEYKKLFSTKYIISYGSIIKKKLFFKIILDNNYEIWNKKTPFGFEKNSWQTNWLPLKIGYLKNEIFASIDDDNNPDFKSLQSRGLYPIRIKRRTTSKHLWQYLNAGKKFELKNKINSFIKNFFLCYFLLRKKIKIKIILTLAKNINYKEYSYSELKLLTYILKYKFKNTILHTLDEQFTAILKLKKVNVRIISNKIFPKSSNDKITLSPLKILNKKKYHNRSIYNGYLIKMKLDPDLHSGSLLVIHEKLFYLYFEKLIKIKYEKIGPFFIANF